MRQVSPTRPAGPPGDPAWLRAAFTAPAFVGSFCALVLLDQTHLIESSLRRWLNRSRRPSFEAMNGCAPLAAVRAAVVGRGKDHVAALFGAPIAATAGPQGTWYYPLRHAERQALAITFTDDLVSSVELFRAPLPQV